MVLIKKTNGVQIFFLLCSLLLCSWYILPSLNSRITYPYIAIPAIILFILSYKNNKNFIFLLIILSSIISFFYFLVPYPLNIKKAINIFEIQVIYYLPIVIFFYFYINKDYSSLRIICIYISILLFFVLMRTIIQLQINPRVVRDLATGSNDNELYYLRMQNIGGYGFSYSICILLPLLFKLFNKERYFLRKILMLIIIGVCIYFVLKAQYTILLLVTVFFMFYVLIDNLNVFFKVLLILFTLIFFPLLPDFLLFLANQINGIQMSNRLVDLANYIQGYGLYGGVQARIDSYLAGISVFFTSPIWGVFQMSRSPLYYDFIGSHSTIIGLACEIGIIGVFIYLFTYRFIFKGYNRVICRPQFTSIFKIPFFVLIVIMFINPTFETMNISIVLFLYVPILILFSNKKELLDEKLEN